IYIADDTPSRQQHESSLSHKRNRERFVRSTCKAGPGERREMARVEQTAQIVFRYRSREAQQRPYSCKPPPEPSNPFTKLFHRQIIRIRCSRIPDADFSQPRSWRMQGVAGE
ncbi:hypothetical protein B0H14DRAFT_2334827, partial [Mycena olivaceomarginata]